MSCVVCGASPGGVQVSTTPLRTSASVGSFLLDNCVVGNGAIPDGLSSVKLCGSCAAEVFVCDQLSYRFWHKIEGLKAKHATKSVVSSNVALMDSRMDEALRRYDDKDVVDEQSTISDHDVAGDLLNDCGGTQHEDAGEAGETSEEEESLEWDDGTKAESKAANQPGPIHQTCPVCKKTVMRGRDRLFLHMIINHSISRARRCWDCGLSSSCRADHERHLAEHRQALLGHVACIHCRLVMHADAFEGHVRINHPSGLVRTREERISLGMKVEKCPDCRFWCTTKEDWELHRLQAHGNKHYRCIYCDELYSSDLSLVRHLRYAHLGEPIMKCSLCKKSFYVWTLYFRHLQVRHASMNMDEVFDPCPYCEERASPKSLKEHVHHVHGVWDRVEDIVKLIEENGGPLNKPNAPEDGDEERDSRLQRLCRRQKRRATDAELRSKRVELGKKKRLEVSVCPECGRQISCHVASMFRHFEEVHKIEEGERCWDCGRYFLTKAELQKHLGEHRRQLLNYVTCIHCRKTILAFAMDGHVNRIHAGSLARTRAERVAAGVAELNCKECPFWTTVKHDFKYHGVKAHGSRSVFSCKECHLEFPSDLFLMTHVSTVHEQKPRFKCAACGEEFLTQGKYKYHVKKHRTVDVVCPVCAATVKDYAIHTHMKVHERVEASCPECGKKFLKCNLQNHMAAIHGIGERNKTPRKTFACSECDYKVTNKRSLAFHMNTSHGVELPESVDTRPETCTFCGKTFERKGLYAHLRQQHGILRTQFLKTGLVCNICRESAAEKTSFIEHLNNIHGLNLRKKEEFKDYVVMPDEEGEGLVDDV